MSQFKFVKAADLDESPFRLIGKDWMLITAEKDNKINSMTASWGGLGVIWNKNVAYIVIRKSRFTKEFVDGSDSFSLTFFDHKDHQKMLNYMGTVSGRDEDKINSSGLTVKHEDGIPYFEEAKTVMLCKKLAKQPIVPESYIDRTIDDQWYADKDYHDLYIGEIIQILQK